MLKLTVTFDQTANRPDQTVVLHNHEKLDPRAAIAARNVAAGVGANAWVSDGRVTYRVTRSKARKVR
jgi:hypothetical protein